MLWENLQPLRNRCYDSRKEMRREKAMPQFDSELIQAMKCALEDTMTTVPLEHSTPAAKAYLAECILKAAAQGLTNYDALVADHIHILADPILHLRKEGAGGRERIV
jgi:hypothetical protein